MDRIYRFFFCCLLAAFAVSCGSTVKLTEETHLQTPTPAEADSLLSALAAVPDAVSYVVERADGPYVYGLQPVPDSAKLRIVIIKPQKDHFELMDDFNYECYREPFTDLSLIDSLNRVQIIGQDTVLVIGTIFRTGKMTNRSIAAYNISNELISEICFSGKQLSDGSLEGFVDDFRIPTPTAPVAVWERSTLMSDPSLHVISRADMISDNSIGWWNHANPDALSNAPVIKFGQLDEGSSIVEAYNKAAKEKNSKYIVAEFDIRGYSVIVCYRKSSGNYLLCWAEPVKYKGRQLNTIYFENENSLAMYYYHGKKVYKYHLNLANGKITR